MFAHRAAASTTAELYDDDGVTPDWDNGTGRLLTLTLQTDGTARATLIATSSGSYAPAYGRIQVETIGGSVQVAAGSDRWLA